MAHVVVKDLFKQIRRPPGRARHRLRDRRGRICRARRSLRMRKEHDPQNDRRARNGHRRRHRHRRHGRERHTAARARHRDGVSGLCALSAHVGAAEPRLRTEDARRQRGRRSTPRSNAPPRSCRSRACSSASPRSLSGGQRQRVAIGRAIAREPGSSSSMSRFPISTPQLRVDMRTQIKRLHMAFRATSVYVTHDQTEAMTLADRIVALRNGVIEQMGTPEELYARPANSFVAGFIGSPKMNFLKGQIVLENGRRSLFPQAPRSCGCRSPSAIEPRRPGRRHRHSPRAPHRYTDGAWPGCMGADRSEGRAFGTPRRGHARCQPDRRGGSRVPGVGRLEA